MGLFHKTLLDAEKLVEKNPEAAIKILIKHETKASGIVHRIGRNGIMRHLETYQEAIYGLRGAIARGDMRDVKGFFKFLRSLLISIRKDLDVLQQCVELE